jgi:hypothetical protein
MVPAVAWHAQSVLLATLSVVIVLFSTGAPSAHSATYSDPASYGAGDWPPGTWRPFSSSSPWNQPLPPDPKIDPGSSSIVQHLVDQGSPAPVRVGTADTTSDYNHPYYIAHESDPLYRVEGGSSVVPYDVNGMYVHLPAGARPATGPDHHLAVIDQGYEWGFWNASVDQAARAIAVSTGRKVPVSGNGLQAACTAGRFTCLDGIIRAQELGGPSVIDGGTRSIQHALFMAVNKLDNGDTVFPGYPANGSPHGSQTGLTFGTRFQLDLSDDQIDALPVPFWSKRIFRAMAHYGMIVGDQTSVPWKVEVESGSTYTSLGYEDPWVQIAQTWGVPHYYDGNSGRDVYSMDLSGPDWSRHLRVIDPCVSAGAC